jgi:hypothetical protein
MQGLKPIIFLSLYGPAKQAAEKVSAISLLFCRAAYF